MTKFKKDLSNLSYTNKDFQTIYPEQLELAKELSNRWDPTHSNESDPGVVLLKENSLIADKLNYNIDKNILETFPASVTQYDNAMKLYSQLGYTMRWYHSAHGKISMRIDDTDTDFADTDYFIIPRFTMVCDENEQYIYTIIQDVRLPTDGTVVDDIEVMQGICHPTDIESPRIYTIQDIDSDRRLYINDRYVAENGIFVSNYTESYLFSEYWERVDNVSTYDLGSKVYSFGYDATSNQCYLEFPDDINNLIKDGLVIYYLSTSGTNGNITARTLSKFYNNIYADFQGRNDFERYDLNSGTVKITNLNEIIGGEEPEDLDSAYRNWKHTAGTFNTLVTLRDYINYILKSDNKLASNGFVTDRTNDPQTSYKIVSQEGRVTNYKIVQSPDLFDDADMKSFELKLYLLQYIDKPKVSSGINSLSITDYEESYKLLGPEPDDKTLMSIDSVKSIQHDFKNILPNRICYIKNKFPIDIKIIPNYNLTLLQKEDLSRKVVQTLTEKFNAKTFEFGTEASYYDIYDELKDCDDRIETILIDTINYNTYVVYFDENYTLTEVDITNPDLDSDGFEMPENKSIINTFRNEIFIKSVLAGVTQLYTPDSDKIEFNLNQTPTLPNGVISDVYAMDTELSLTLRHSVPYTLGENETVNIYKDSYLVDTNFSNYFKFLLISKDHSYSRYVGTSTTEKPYQYTDTIHDYYKIKPNEYLILFGKTNSTSESYTYYKYGPGTIIKTTLNKLVYCPNNDKLNYNKVTFPINQLNNLSYSSDGKGVIKDENLNIFIEDLSKGTTKYYVSGQDSIGKCRINSVKPTSDKSIASGNTMYMCWITHNGTNPSKCYLFGVNKPDNPYIISVSQEGIEGNNGIYHIEAQRFLSDSEYFMYSYGDGIQVLSTGTKIQVSSIIKATSELNARAQFINKFTCNSRTYKDILDNTKINNTNWKQISLSNLTDDITISEQEIISLGYNTTLTMSADDAQAVLTANNIPHSIEDGISIDYYYESESSGITSTSDTVYYIDAHLNINASNKQSQAIINNKIVNVSSPNSSVSLNKRDFIMEAYPNLLNDISEHAEIDQTYTFTHEEPSSRGQSSFWKLDNAIVQLSNYGITLSTFEERFLTSLDNALSCTIPSTSFKSDTSGKYSATGKFNLNITGKYVLLNSDFSSNTLSDATLDSYKINRVTGDFTVVTTARPSSDVTFTIGGNYDTIRINHSTCYKISNSSGTNILIVDNNDEVQDVTSAIEKSKYFTSSFVVTISCDYDNNTVSNQSITSYYYERTTPPYTGTEYYIYDSSTGLYEEISPDSINDNLVLYEKKSTVILGTDRLLLGNDVIVGANENRFQTSVPINMPGGIDLPVTISNYAVSTSGAGSLTYFSYPSFYTFIRKDAVYHKLEQPGDSKVGGGTMTQDDIDNIRASVINRDGEISINTDGYSLSVEQEFKMPIGNYILPIENVQDLNALTVKLYYQSNADLNNFAWRDSDSIPVSNNGLILNKTDVAANDTTLVAVKSNASLSYFRGINNNAFDKPNSVFTIIAPNIEDSSKLHRAVYPENIKLRPSSMSGESNNYSEFNNSDLESLTYKVEHKLIAYEYQSISGVKIDNSFYATPFAIDSGSYTDAIALIRKLDSNGNMGLRLAMKSEIDAIYSSASTLPKLTYSDYANAMGGAVWVDPESDATTTTYIYDSATRVIYDDSAASTLSAPINTDSDIGFIYLVSDKPFTFNYPAQGTYRSETIDKFSAYYESITDKSIFDDISQFNSYEFSNNSPGLYYSYQDIDYSDSKIRVVKFSKPILSYKFEYNYSLPYNTLRALFKGVDPKSIDANLSTSEVDFQFRLFDTKSVSQIHNIIKSHTTTNNLYTLPSFISTALKCKFVSRSPTLVNTNIDNSASLYAWFDPNGVDTVKMYITSNANPVSLNDYLMSLTINCPWSELYRFGTYNGQSSMSPVFAIDIPKINTIFLATNNTTIHDDSTIRYIAQYVNTASRTYSYTPAYSSILVNDTEGNIDLKKKGTHYLDISINNFTPSKLSVMIDAAKDTLGINKRVNILPIYKYREPYYVDDNGNKINMWENAMNSSEYLEHYDNKAIDVELNYKESGASDAEAQYRIDLFSTSDEPIYPILKCRDDTQSVYLYDGKFAIEYKPTSDGSTVTSEIKKYTVQNNHIYFIPEENGIHSIYYDDTSTIKAYISFYTYIDNSTSVNQFLSPKFIFMRNKLRAMDENKYYDYTYIVPNDRVIFNPLEPTSYFDNNHPFNKFTIPSIETRGISVTHINKIR